MWLRNIQLPQWGMQGRARAASFSFFPIPFGHPFHPKNIIKNLILPSGKSFLKIDLCLLNITKILWRVSQRLSINRKPRPIIVHSRRHPTLETKNYQDTVIFVQSLISATCLIKTRKKLMDIWQNTISCVSRGHITS